MNQKTTALLKRLAETESKEGVLLLTRRNHDAAYELVDLGYAIFIQQSIGSPHLAITYEGLQQVEQFGV